MFSGQQSKLAVKIQHETKEKDLTKSQEELNSSLNSK